MGSSDTAMLRDSRSRQVMYMEASRIYEHRWFCTAYYTVDMLFQWSNLSVISYRDKQ